MNDCYDFILKIVCFIVDCFVLLKNYKILLEFLIVGLLIFGVNNVFLLIFFYFKGVVLFLNF